MPTHDRHESFEVGPHARLVGRFGAADVSLETAAPDSPDAGYVRVTVRASGSRRAEVLDRTRIEQDGSTVLVEVPRSAVFFGGGPRIHVLVTLPPGSDVELTTGSGDVVARGELGDVSARAGSADVRLDVVQDVELQTGSGDVTVERGRAVAARTGSGTVRVGRLDGASRLTTGSGDVTVDAAHDLEVRCGSGRVTLESVEGAVQARTGSGSVTVRRAGPGRLAVSSGSGTIRVGVAAGVTAHLDVSTSSGSIRSELEPTGPAEPGAPTLELRASAQSGDVHLTRTG